MSALEVPGDVLFGDVLAIVAVDSAGEEHRLTVHLGVLEAVEYFQAGERWRTLQGHTANRTEVRIELPTGCGRDGLLALLRRLYSRRPWPASAWAGVGPVAAQGAAVLADMWLLGNLAKEARPRGGVITVEAFNASVLNAYRDRNFYYASAARVRAISELWENQVELGVEYLDVLIEVMNRAYVCHRSSAIWCNIWCNATSHGCRAYPDRLRAAISVVSSKHIFPDCLPDCLVQSCVKSFLDAARVARAAGDLSGETYDAIILDIPWGQRQLISSEMILEMQAEAQAKLINRDVQAFSTLPHAYEQELLSAITSIDLADGAAKRAGKP